MEAYTNYDGQKWDEAINASKSYISKYPNTKDAAYAQYLFAMSNFNQIPDTTRDQDRAEKALVGLNELIQKFPTSEYAGDARYRVQVARDQIAGNYMEVGRYYLERRNYTAAINRFRDVVSKYQTTRHVEEALERLTEGLHGPRPDRRGADGGGGSRPQLPGQRVVQGRLRANEVERLGAARGRGVLDQPQLQGASHDRAGRVISRQMLLQLLIRDIVLIERLDIRFPAGLSVLTGETGAGKSILLDAFALALGARGDGSLVRHGESQGQVTAVFDVAADHPARLFAQAAELAVEGDMILRRIQFADGRTRALVNDQPVSVQTLRELGAGLGRDPRPACRPRARRCDEPPVDPGRPCRSRP